MHAVRPALVLALAAAAASAQGAEPLFRSAWVDLTAPSPDWTASQTLAAGDLDGDGRDDVVASLEPGVQLLFSGDDGLQPGPLIVPASHDGPLALADFDGDGLLDLLSDPSSSPTVDVRLGDGCGGFGTPASVDLGLSVQSVSVSDLDVDGELDIAGVGYSSLKVAVVRGAGDGTFGPMLHFWVGGSTLWAVAGGDVHGDGIPDLVVSRDSPADVAVLAGLGGLAYVATVSQAVSGSARPLALRDLDADGDADVVVGTFASGDLLLLRGGPAGLSPPELLWDGFNWVQAVTVADLDEDGTLDVAAWIDTLDGSGTYLQGNCILTLRQGAAGWEPGFVGGPAGARALVAAEVDGDGDTDLLSHATKGQVMVAHGDGDGAFEAPVLTGYWPADVAAGDFDADGLVDAAVAHWGMPHAVSLHRGRFADGPGPAEPVATLPSTLEGVAAGDLDGDGALDLVAGGFGLPGAGSVQVLLGDGRGAFLPPVAAGGDWPVNDLVLQDMDGDGDLDLVAARLNGTVGDEDVLLFENGPAGVLTQLSSLPLPGSVSGLDAGDLDADGRPDIVATTREPPFPPPAEELLAVLRQRDWPLFFEPVMYAAGFDFQQRVALADVTGDGRLDAIVARLSGATALWRGTGTGTLLPLESLPAGAVNGFDVLIEDFDADGLPDLAVTSGLSTDVSQAPPGALSVSRGLGDGEFEPPLVLSGPDVQRGAAAADVDGDGRLDVLAVAQDLLAVYANTSGPWTALGHPLPGTLGLPRLRGFGPLVSGADVWLELTDGKPSSSSYFVLGATAGELPFHGGVLVPVPTLVLAGLPTDAEGHWLLGAPWPAGLPSGTTFVSQAWIPDALAPQGYAASNGLAAQSP